MPSGGILGCRAEIDHPAPGRAFGRAEDSCPAPLNLPAIRGDYRASPANTASPKMHGRNTPMKTKIATALVAALTLGTIAVAGTSQAQAHHFHGGWGWGGVGLGLALGAAEYVEA